MKRSNDISDSYATALSVNLEGMTFTDISIARFSSYIRNSFAELQFTSTEEMGDTLRRALPKIVAVHFREIIAAMAIDGIIPSDAHDAAKAYALRNVLTGYIDSFTDNEYANLQVVIQEYTKPGALMRSIQLAEDPEIKMVHPDNCSSLLLLSSSMAESLTVADRIKILTGLLHSLRSSPIGRGRVAFSESFG